MTITPTTLVQLAPHVVVEPLVASYPAWWCNFSPLPATLHLAGYQLPALRSFVRSPRTHRKAARDPALAGGPFVNLDDGDVPWVERHLAYLERAFAEVLPVASDYWGFVERVLAEGQGQTLEPLYDAIPPTLRGLAELVYDYHARPFVRVDEALAYTSPLFRPELQSLRLHELVRDGDRPFYMSTPRPLRADEIDWAVRFDDPHTGRLLELDVTPLPFGELRTTLASATHVEHLERFVVPAAAPVARPAPASGTVRIHYVGHACVLVETASSTVLFDPFVSPPAREARVPRASFADLPPRIDAAAVTHAHPDHLAFEALLRLRGRIGTLVVPKSFGVAIGDVSLRQLGRRLGYANVVDLETLDSVPLPGGGRLTATPFYGEHGDILHGNKASFLLEVEGRRLLFAADSTCLDVDVFTRLRARFGPIDTVFMNTEINGSPISWPFDALFPKARNVKAEKTRVCRGSNADEGLRLLQAVGAKHFYNYAMGLEPWLERIVGPASPHDSPRMIESSSLLDRARAAGIQATRLEGSTTFDLPA